MTSNVTAALKELEPLIRRLSYRYEICGRVDRDDLMQTGRIGALYALQTYRPETGAAFKTYAYHCIRSAMRHYRRDYGALIAIPAYRTEGIQYDAAPPSELPTTICLQSALEAEESGDRESPWLECVEPGYAQVERAELLHPLLECLTPQERQAIALRFGQELELAELAVRLGYRPAYGGTIILRALNKIRREVVKNQWDISLFM